MINTSKKLPGPFLIDLKNKFRDIAGEDHLIDRAEFQNGLNISNKEISDRLFDIFDKDKSGSIDLNEFMETIESITVGTEKDKIKFAFDLHDLDNSGFIDRAELKLLIEQSFLENSLDFDEFQLDLLVDEFFKRADKDKSNTIDYQEFLDVARDYPDFIEGLAVNPVNWLVPDRYEEKKDSEGEQDKKNIFKRPGIQVQDIGIFQWLLIPRLIFLYNILVNRKKNRSHVDLISVNLLPSRIIELTISEPEGFQFFPGDYIYLNCAEVSTMEWYPFNIIRRTGDNNIVLHIKSNNSWSNKFYQNTVDQVGKNQTIDWKIRIDGPYGSSSERVLDADHAIMVGAGHGISRMAPILQDIVMRKQREPDQSNIQRLDLFWLINDRSYFEWFTKLLNDIEYDDKSSFFNYHIFFLDKDPDEITDKLMYISTNVIDSQTDVKLINNLWGRSSFGYPDWSQELRDVCSVSGGLAPSLFFSGPSKLKQDLEIICNQLGISYRQGEF